MAYETQRMAERRDPVVQDLGRSIERLQREAFEAGQAEMRRSITLSGVSMLDLASDERFTDAEFRAYVRRNLT